MNNKITSELREQLTKQKNTLIITRSLKLWQRGCR